MQVSQGELTLGSLIEDKVTILEIIAGKSQLDFTVKSGGRLDFRTSAHGLVALAFGPKDLLAAQSGTGEVETLYNRVAEIRRDGWATAIDSVEYWANALAAPVFDAKGVWRGSIAMAGPSRELPAKPTRAQEQWIKSAAIEASQVLGWRGVGM